MIVKFFCDILFSFVRFLIGLFPSFPRFDSLDVSFDPLLYVIRFVNLFISIKVVAGGILLLLVVYNIKFVWSILMWLIRKIPGVS